MKKKKNKHKEGKLTKKMRENPWIASTFVLGIVCLIFLIAGFAPELPEEDLIEIKLNESVCPQILRTPAWLNETGQVQEGYTDFNNISSEVMVDLLIKNRIYFVWRAGCIWCEKQIDYFGDSWIKYRDSGFTIRC